LVLISHQNWVQITLKYMSYPERKPIYETYEAIVKKIIEEKKFKDYAESSIDELDASLLAGFKSIRNKLIVNKDWSPE
jgi:hypothetical protein